MTLFGTPIAAVSPYATAAIALAGSLIGGLIAGSAALLVARQARRAAERAWMRDNRREIYDRFLTSGQKLLIACQRSRRARSGEGAETARLLEAVEDAHTELFEVYGVVQTVAEAAVVDASRVYAYRLLALRDGMGSSGALKSVSLAVVGDLIREGRHATIDAMRAELGLTPTAWPPKKYNPFVGTELEGRYAAALAART